MSIAQMVSWDEWRACYDTWTVEEQRAFYDQVFVGHREQQRFDAKRLGGLLNYIGEYVTVVELGGWDGEFAAEMLADYQEIERWENHEVSWAAVAESVCEDVRYMPFPLERFYWETPHKADVFVASHVLEHLSLRDVRGTFDATNARFMFLQAPLDDGPTDWRGYHGSHILEVGWGTLVEDLAARGYRELAGLSHPWARCFERRT